MQFKFWVRHAKYDQADTSDFANKPFTVAVHNPKGEKVFEKAFTADAYGGLAGEFAAAQGRARWASTALQIVNHGGGSFRVEEYKKPEFEVKVEAPKEPVRLGEKIEATIQAKYYFGAPVTQGQGQVQGDCGPATAATGIRPGRWDWFYGRGYWWFAADYAWYPGWRRVGLQAARCPGGIGRNQQPPEVVLENEVDDRPRRHVKVAIDTLPAKELHGDQDHQYTITAEVVDESRRTIVGTGNVLVSRKPFQVFAWVDRGYYRAGDTVEASFSAQTLDQKPVEGKGELTLYKVSYNDKSEPVEKAVQTWKLDTNAEGQARQQLKAAEPGQYRLSYKLTDAQEAHHRGRLRLRGARRGLRRQATSASTTSSWSPTSASTPRARRSSCWSTPTGTDGTVLLFVRPTNGVYLPPKVLRLKGKSIEEEIARGPEGHAELLRRGGDGRRRQGAHGDARGGRAAGKARAERGGAAVAAGVQAGAEGDGEGEADRPAAASRSSARRC